MRDVSKKIEMLANAAIIVVAILLCVVLARNYVFRGSGSRPNQLTAGKKLTIDGVDWTGNHQTLLLVVAKNCHFCSESAGFYQRLDAEISRGGDVRLLAVVPHDVQSGRDYLDGLKVRVDDVKQVQITAIGISGTPTLVLVDSEGVVKNVWTGKLPPETESQIIDTIRGSATRS